MAAPERELAGCRAAHATLLAEIEDLTDEQARQPSLLPGWSVGHLLTHIARNADSVVRRLQGAARGEVVSQYEGGIEGRAAEIGAGAGRSAAALIDDVRTSAARCDDACAAVDPEVWTRPIVGLTGVEAPAASMALARWREVEVHHVDLGLGYRPERWPAELVDAALPQVLAGLPDRSEPAALLAWAIGRGPAPELGPW